MDLARGKVRDQAHAIAIEAMTTDVHSCNVRMRDTVARDALVIAYSAELYKNGRDQRAERILGAGGDALESSWVGISRPAIECLYIDHGVSPDEAVAYVGEGA